MLVAWPEGQSSALERTGRVSFARGAVRRHEVTWAVALVVRREHCGGVAGGGQFTFTFFAPWW